MEQKGQQAEQEDSLTDRLRLTVDTYQRRATEQADFWRVALPALVTLFVAGPVVLAYGMGLFVPMVDLLKTIAEVGN